MNVMKAKRKTDSNRRIDERLCTTERTNVDIQRNLLY